MKADVRYQAAILRDHHILLLKAWDHSGSGKTFWEIPGGGKETGETEEECVIREVREETHLEVEIDRLIADDADFPDSAYQKRKTYICRILSGEPQPGIEPEVDSDGRNTIQSIGWFDLRDPSTWDPLALNDPITFRNVERVRIALGYGNGEMDDFYTGPGFYDNEEVFSRYRSHRNNNPDSPNDTLEKPVVQELVGDLAGLNILDLGCGDAGFGRELLARGARSYLGVDGSSNMIAAAQKTLAGTEGQAVLGDLESWEPPESAFDVVVSRLVLHYILHLDRLLEGIYQSLAIGGHFVFSIEHPVITSCNRSYPPGSIRQDWIVDDYFDTGPRTPIWLGQKVLKVHRTVEDYFLGLQAAGFIVESLRESRPRRELFASEETFLRRKRIPLFLFFAARRPD